MTEQAQLGSERAVLERPALPFFVFLAGTGSMATEICASRLLAPNFGDSTMVWANIIGLILASLSLGYWLGGRIADRHPSSSLLGAIVLAAALFVAIIPFVAHPLLEYGAKGIEQVAVGTVVGSFFAALVLFTPPVVLLGMVAPFAIKLSLEQPGTAGGVAGTVFALSTAGSLLGTFVPALVSIPLIGTQRTLLATATLLVATSALALGRRGIVPVLCVGALLALPPGAIRPGANVLYEGESAYQFIRVVQDGSERVLELNEGVVAHSVYNPASVLTGGYWDLPLVLPALLDHPVRRVAILGNAGGTVARAYRHFYPRARVDGVEIDAKVSAIGERFFGLLPGPLLHVYNEDARPFLLRRITRYDVIYVDAYRQPYVPFYLTTREFFQLVQKRLRPGGVVALNVAALPRDHELVAKIAGTMATVFPQVLSWQALRFNALVVGVDRSLAPGALARSSQPVPAPIRPLLPMLERQARLVAPSSDPWTDDRAPVEWVVDRMIVRAAREGVSLDEERTLPTAP
ncbi:MAG: fused MFS/spermidine synthase [Gaiellaceae bacterium]|jgi:spermidine synthase